ncbi:MAG TPA: hypothetical protein VMN36_04405 [Verrucomicrobiales bacterium]|nr:hypothetical protein [Verrucomicrobiales bacterium]
MIVPGWPASEPYSGAPRALISRTQAPSPDICPRNSANTDPPPAPPFDIETLEPLDHLGAPGAPGHWDWDSQEEAPLACWWKTGGPADPEAAWEAPQLLLGDGRLLMLDTEPARDDGLPVYRAG